jgi:WD40 repeat protein/energy-coupling factor transporter ATP-binding protein EcfA2
VFAERFALLYAAAGDPPLKRVAESVARARRVDDRGRPIRVSVQRLSDWRRGRNVPARFAALAVTLEILIGEARKIRPIPVAEGLYDLKEWRLLWERALNSPAATDETTTADMSDQGDTGVCPYRGLAQFRQEDAEWFFGRERSTTALVNRLSAVSRTGGIIMLVGASGAGKSSVLRAGLVPALAQETGSAHWPAITMTPGANPLNELAGHVPDLNDVLSSALSAEDHAAGADQLAAAISSGLTAYAERESGGDGRLVLVVDQFEEIFTLCADENHRRLFVQTLHAAATASAGAEVAPALVVLGVRADFYGQCLDYPELAEALQDRQMVLGAMTVTELRDAVIRPAKAVGLQFETGLVDLILRDLAVSRGTAKGGRYDPGALPLLSHALLATWQRRQAGKLTIAGYRATGGIQGAVAATAEQAWAQLPTHGQSAAREVLLRLVHVGRDTQDTRRRSTREDVVARSANRAAADEALEVLTRARLVTLDADSVEITHEALLQAWPRLRSWIDRDRAGNLARQRLEEDAESWDSDQRDASLLYRGARLESALHRAQLTRPTGIARDFLAASARQHRRMIWTRRAAVALVCVLAVVAGIAAVVALQERNDAEFRQVVAEADRLQEIDPSLSAQLDLVAHHMRPDDLDVSSRILSTQNTPLATPITGHTGAIYETTFSPDGQTLVTAGYDKTIRLWDVHDRTRPVPLGAPLTAHTSWITSAVFSPDGHTLATAGDDKVVRLWDVTDLAHPTMIGQPLNGGNGTIYSLSYSVDGHTIVTANEDHTARLWDVRNPADPKPLGQPLTGHTAPVRSVQFSSDGRTLATAGDDTTVRLWDITNPAQPSPLGRPLTGNTDTVHSVKFSPNGQILATAGEDKSVRLWNVADPVHAAPLGQPLTRHSAPVWEVAFSPDGYLLASAAMDNTTRLWNLTDPANPSPVGQPLASNSDSGARTVAFSPDGHTLAVGAEGSVVHLWSMSSTVLVGHSYWVSSLAFTPDGRGLVTASGDKTARLWNISDPARPERSGPPLAGHSQYIDDLALTPDGHTLATISGDTTVRLWNVNDFTHPEPLGPPITLDTRYGGPVTFNPDGHILATKDKDVGVLFWDVTDRRQPKPLGKPFIGHTSYVNDFAFSTRHIFATASSDETIRLWNVDNPVQPTPFAPITGHTGEVTSVAFSPDGRLLASASDDKTVRLWDVTNPAQPVALGTPLTGHTESVGSAAFSPDGHVLATTGKDKTVRLWDVRDPVAPHAMGQIHASVEAGYALAFSPDGQFLAVGTGDNLVRLWDLNPEHARMRICATTQNVLTPELWEQHLPQLGYQSPC